MTLVKFFWSALTTFCFSFLPLVSQSWASQPVQVFIHESVYQDLKDVLKQAFDFPINFHPFSGAMQGLILQQLRNHPHADVVIGADLSQWPRCQELADPTPIKASLHLPFPWPHLHIVPFCYSYLTLLHDGSLQLQDCQTLEELLTALPANSMAMPDPRTSMVGQDFLNWVAHSHPHEGWGTLCQKIATYPSGWYGTFQLFVKRKVKAMVGYTTSLPYHHSQGHSWVKAALLPQGHPIQPMLLFRVRKATPHPQTDRLVAMMLSETIQQHLPLQNHTYPVIETKLPVFFRTHRPVKAFLLQPSPTQREQYRKAWQAIQSRG